MKLLKLPKWDKTKGSPEPIRALNKIKLIENNDPVVEITSLAPSVRLMNQEVIPYSRKEVAIMLEKASKLLPNGIYFSVFSAYRPLSHQIKLYEKIWGFAQEAFPNESYASLRRRVNRWVAPCDQKAPPGHSTGAAVDVTLVDENNNELDMTSPFKQIGAPCTFTIGLSQESQANRMMLYNAMTTVGFSNCRDEWWHYSYGDAGWAVRLEHSECYYGQLDVPLEFYERQNKEWIIERLNKFPNPFIEQESATWPELQKK
jgi:D-alanyl-D-alanine dipeptidase